MPASRPDVKPRLQPAIATGPGAYERWHGTLARITEGPQQRRILDLIGPVDGRRGLDLGCGDGVLTTTLAARGARAGGIDADRPVLEVASLKARGWRSASRVVSDL